MVSQHLYYVRVPRMHRMLKCWPAVRPMGVRAVPRCQKMPHLLRVTVVDRTNESGPMIEKRTARHADSTHRENTRKLSQAMDRSSLGGRSTTPVTSRELSILHAPPPLSQTYLLRFPRPAIRC